MTNRGTQASTDDNEDAVDVLRRDENTKTKIIPRVTTGVRLFHSSNLRRGSGRSLGSAVAAGCDIFLKNIYTRTTVCSSN